MSKVADVDGIKNGLSGRSHCRQRRGIFVGCSASASIPSALLLALGFLLSQKHKAHLLGLEPVGVGRTGAGVTIRGSRSPRGDVMQCASGVQPSRTKWKSCFWFQGAWGPPMAPLGWGQDHR